MKIYSCTMFGREFPQLDLKIAEESNYVDEIIVVEGTRTHTNVIKPLYLPGRYENPKVKIVVMKNFVNDVVKNESNQRNMGLPPYLRDEDVLIYGDDDEINHGEEIEYIVSQAKKYGLVKLKLDLYHYKINLRCNNPIMEYPYPQLKVVPNAPVEWKWSFAVTGEYIRKSKMTLTQLRYTDAQIIETKGKHFSYLGGPKEISWKIKNSLHSKKKDIPYFTNEKSIEKQIANMKTVVFEQATTLTWVEIDESYPKTILNNLDKWKEHIAPKSLLFL